jgi:hypothetical protein
MFCRERVAIGGLGRSRRAGSAESLRLGRAIDRVEQGLDEGGKSSG